MLKTSNAFLVNIVYPDNNTTTKKYSVRETVEDIINDNCKQLDIKRQDIFGIAIYEYNEYRFISLKKRLNKVLPSEAIIVDGLQRTGNNDADINAGKKKLTTYEIESTLKTCRLYLRVKHFLTNVNDLSGKILYYYYEQSRLDTLKYQNWLQLDDYGDVFNDIAAKIIWLKYGGNWKNIVEQKKLALNFVLPVCEQTEVTWKVLERQLCLLDKALYEDKSNPQHGDVIDMIPLTKRISSSLSSQTLSSIITDEDVVFMDINESVMISLIHDTLKLPYYGIHFYHVSVRNDGKNLTNCKLGIGPFGLMIVVAPFYTRWSESEIISWTRVIDVNHDKSLLEVSLFQNESKESTKCNQFECLNEKEARYLYKELKESHSFQTNRKSSITKHKKRNSVGVFHSGDTPSPATIIRRSSFSFLMLPKRREHQKDSAG